MKTATISPQTEAAVWTRILHPNGELTPAAARVILKLSIPPTDRSHMRELLVKARAGTLTPDQENEMEVYERAAALLSTLKSRARQLLAKRVRNP